MGYTTRNTNGLITSFMRDLELPGRSPVHAPIGMAATSNPLSTQVAIDVLKNGGNAMDAAVAACAVQCVVEPQSTGIGGDCFCLFSQEGAPEIVAFNGSGKAPAAANVEWYQSHDIKSIDARSPHAVTVPSAIDAWNQLVRDHGRRDLGELLQPAIGYARDGYPIHSRVYSDFVQNESLLRAEQSTAAVFLPNNKIPVVGQRHIQPALAKTLQKIAEGGRDAFYSGDVAGHLVEYLQSKGGLHTLSDFAAVQGNYVDAISTNFRDHTIFECPPNGQGVIALLLLNIMSGFTPDSANPITADRLHLELEAARLAYRSRTIYVGDPAFSDIPVEELLSEAFADQLRGMINPHKASEPPEDIHLPRHEDTVYITVVDKDRNACSFINTLFMSFGSGLVEPETGVVLHNRGNGFVIDPSSPNCIAGGKRPLHTIIPGMANKNDRLAMSFGVMGGQYQAFGHMQFLTRLLDYGMDIQEAMDAPRTMVNPFTGEVEIERNVPDSIKQELTARGHRVVPAKKPIGGSQAISIDWQQNMLTGGSDPRKDGCVIGY